MAISFFRNWPLLLGFFLGPGFLRGKIGVPFSPSFPVFLGGDQKTPTEFPTHSHRELGSNIDRVYSKTHPPINPIGIPVEIWKNLLPKISRGVIVSGSLFIKWKIHFFLHPKKFTDLGILDDGLFYTHHSRHREQKGLSYSTPMPFCLCPFSHQPLSWIRGIFIFKILWSGLSDHFPHIVINGWKAKPPPFGKNHPP